MPRQSAVLAREVRVIRSSFRQLASAFGKLGPYLTAAPSPDGNSAGAKTRRKPRLAAAQRAALKLQGKYMGTMRGLKPGQRAKVKKIRAARGIKAAIRAAERMAG